MTEGNTPSPQRALWSWVLYDWANSAFSAIIMTFVYVTFFTKSVVSDPVQGMIWWGYALTISGVFIAIISPVSGAIADHYGSQKRWLTACTLLTVLSMSGLWFGVPGAEMSTILLILGCFIIANTAFEAAFNFYSALLPRLAPLTQIGRWSQIGWGFGYLGGLISLSFVLIFLIGIGPLQPLLSLPNQDAIPVRASVLVTIGWFVLFSIPLLVFVPNPSRSKLSLRQSIGYGLKDLKSQIHHLFCNQSRSDKKWRIFLLSSALYRDGLNTLFAIGGGYAASRYGMSLSEVLIFGIIMNMAAGAGCFVSAIIERHASSQAHALKIIRISLIGLLITGVMVIAAPDKMIFMSAALALGLWIGPLQAASRTMLVHICPPAQMNAGFGLYALVGRSVAFLGPLAFAMVTDITGNQSIGLSTVLLFWGIGLALILRLTRERTA